MNKHSSTLLTFMVSAILISNAIALIGVVRNRAGAPAQEIELTERELPLTLMGQDNSGVVLRLNWANRPFINGRNPAGFRGNFDRAKLEELGFRLGDPATALREHRSPSPRPAFVALEYEGGAWQRWLGEPEVEAEKPDRPGETYRNTRPQTQPKDPAMQKLQGSRLFVVDASSSLEQLRVKYPDQRRCLIVRAVVRATAFDARERKTEGVADPNWRGYVMEALPDEIFVPAPYASMLPQRSFEPCEAPRYSILLKYNRKLEPWIADVRLLDAAPKP